MTDKELREAAERIVMSKEFGFSLWPGTGDEAELAYDAEAEAVAGRLLELLPPADDGEPVTADRVEKLGVKLDANKSDYRFADLRTNLAVMGSVNGSHVSLSLMFREDGMLAACDMDATTYADDGHEDAIDTEFTMPTPQTMGNFKRLCAALGITLQEPHQ